MIILEILESPKEQIIYLFMDQIYMLEQRHTVRAIHQLLSVANPVALIKLKMPEEMIHM
ncbi:MAG: hypothetical protein IPN15_16590 [Saprospiraceae bacterium]|nr:hypothetical protein [Candidatus Vicinibacter affinis]